MPVISIRFSDEPLHRRLKDSAHRHSVGVSTLAERLIDEGLRMEAHPLMVFRDGPSGRRPVLVGGPEVADVIGAIVGGDVPVDQRRPRAAALLGITEALVDAALAYYADFTDEIDADLAARARVADEVEVSWRRQQALLER
ncbi:MAG TPA: CopG family transcriptional regulator [Acidimicrobiia bacterium]|nr:CopG family transcriptional regulator [Acidimicrobiia bacterium]